MNRLIFLLLFLFPTLSLFSLEEKQFQAKILIEETRQPVMIFPLFIPTYEEIKNLFLTNSLSAEYKKYEDPLQSEWDKRDLCGIREPDNNHPEGDKL